jgi:hypothetical protein
MEASTEEDLGWVGSLPIPPARLLLATALVVLFLLVLSRLTTRYTGGNSGPRPAVGPGEEDGPRGAVGDEPSVNTGGSSEEALPVRKSLKNSKCSPEMAFVSALRAANRRI